MAGLKRSAFKRGLTGSALALLVVHVAFGCTGTDDGQGDGATDSGEAGAENAGQGAGGASAGSSPRGGSAGSGAVGGTPADGGSGNSAGEGGRCDACAGAESGGAGHGGEGAGEAGQSGAGSSSGGAGGFAGKTGGGAGGAIAGGGVGATSGGGAGGAMAGSAGLGGARVGGQSGAAGAGGRDCRFEPRPACTADLGDSCTSTCDCCDASATVYTVCRDGRCHWPGCRTSTVSARVECGDNSDCCYPQICDGFNCCRGAGLACGVSPCCDGLFCNTATRCEPCNLHGQPCGLDIYNRSTCCLGQGLCLNGTCT